MKEAIHESGHTLGLRHYDDWRLGVMSASHTVERLDVKGRRSVKAVAARPQGASPEGTFPSTPAQR